MFIDNNHASFKLWWKVNLVKHQKVSKYYENGCGYTTLLSWCLFPCNGFHIHYNGFLSTEIQDFLTAAEVLTSSGIIQKLSEKEAATRGVL